MRTVFFALCVGADQSTSFTSESSELHHVCLVLTTGRWMFAEDTKRHKSDNGLGTSKKGK